MNDRLDAVLEREVPELEQAVFGCAEQIACGVGLGVDCGRGRCAVSVLDVAGCLDKGDGGDSVAVTAQTEETGFSDQVPQDDVGVKTGAGDPQALWIKGECDDSFLVAVEGDRCGVGLCGPQSNAAVLVADGEGVWVGRRPGEGGDFGAVSDLVPGGEKRTPAHVPDKHVLESRDERRLCVWVEDRVGRCRTDQAKGRGWLVAKVRAHHCVCVWPDRTRCRKDQSQAETCVLRDGECEKGQEGEEQAPVCCRLSCGRNFPKILEQTGEREKKKVRVADFGSEILAIHLHSLSAIISVPFRFCLAQESMVALSQSTSTLFHASGIQASAYLAAQCQCPE